MEWLTFLEKFDIHNLIAIAGMFFIFNKYLSKKFEKIDKQFENIDHQFRLVKQDFDKVRDEIKDIDRRLCRIEGSLATKDCCILSENKHTKRVD